ncbi:MAG: hypothetical protein ACYSOW_01655 [Planctomycetota bacterium]|jgi:hypothetical protein
MEPTSEQELRQLLEEDKISQAEYEQLLEAMHPKRRINIPVNRSKISRKKTKVLAILATIALVCFFAGFIFAILANRPLLLVIDLICTILAGINALRYWIAFWTFEENFS